MSSRVANDIQELLVMHHQIREATNFQHSQSQKNGPTLPIFQLYRNDVVIPSKPDLLLFFSCKPFFEEPNIK